MHKKIMYKIFWFIALIFIAANVLANVALPESNNVPGGVVIVPLNQTNLTEPKVMLNNYQVMVIPYHNKWTAVVGIPLTTNDKQIYLTVKNGTNTQKIPLIIKPISYPKENITIKVKRLVTPPKSYIERILREQKIIKAALAKWSNQQNINMHFIWPVKGRISSAFGLQRYYNGQKRSQHSGIDIGVPPNTPIKAPANGTVILTGHYFFMGNAVLLDHGQGLITVYCHMNKILVKLGEKVTQGETIGLVGQTGRATGPHLHWGVRLNGNL